MSKVLGLEKLKLLLLYPGCKFVFPQCCTAVDATGGWMVDDWWMTGGWMVVDVWWWWGGRVMNVTAD